MRAVSEFVFISLAEREWNGKKYYDANVEDLDTGKMFTFDADVTIVPQVVKYKQFVGTFEVNQYGKDIKMRLFHLEPVNK